MAERSRLTWKTERLGALSDGVYAIVVTLLVLDLKAPEAPPGQDSVLLDDLIGQIPNFLAYVVSFLLAALFWHSHHRLLYRVERSDSTLIWLNFVHLFFLSITPFTASLVGRYEDDPVAVQIFAVSLWLVSLSLAAMWHYAAGTSALLATPTTAAERRWFVRRLLGVSLIALLSLVLSGAGNHWALFVWAGLPLLMWLQQRTA